MFAAANQMPGQRAADVPDADDCSSHWLSSTGPRESTRRAQARPQPGERSSPDHDDSRVLTPRALG
jgi:hypothetical protein